MTPDIETLIERLEDSDYREAAIEDAITALRAIQWRPISEAKEDENAEPILVLDATTGIRRVCWWNGHWTYHQKYGGPFTVMLNPTHFMEMPPLPAARASKEG